MVPTVMLNEDTVSYRHCKIWQVLYLKIYISWRQRSFKWWLSLEEIKNIRLFSTSRMAISDRSLQKNPEKLYNSQTESCVTRQRNRLSQFI